MSTLRYLTYNAEEIEKRLGEIETEISDLLNRREALAPEDPERVQLDFEALNLEIELREIGAIIEKPEERPGSMFDPNIKGPRELSLRASQPKPAA